MYNPHKGKPFMWCPNPAHGMHDYFDAVPGGLRCTTCGHIIRIEPKKNVKKEE